KNSRQTAQQSAGSLLAARRNLNVAKETNMASLIAKNWWAIVLRGVFAVIFGVLAYAKPGATLASLIILFGAYALVDGVMSIVAPIMNRTPAAGVVAPPPPRWAMLLRGIVGIGIGLLTFAMPGITALALLNLIAAWAIVTGAFEIGSAIRLRKEIEGEW